MFKKSLLVLALTIPAIGLTGCKSSSKKNDSTMDQQGNGNGNGWGLKLDLNSISRSKFFAAQTFDFGDAEIKKYKADVGTPHEARVTRFSYFLSNGKVLASEKAAQALNQYCEFFVESKTVKNDGSKFKIKEGREFGVVQVSKTVQNSAYSFTVVLQANFGTQYQLMCANVPNVEVLKEHVDSILTITNQNEGPFTPEIEPDPEIDPLPELPEPSKVKEVSVQKNSMGDEILGLVYSKSQKAVSLTVGISSKALSKSTEMTRVFIRLCESKNDSCLTPWYVIHNGPKTNFGHDFVINESFNNKDEVRGIINNLNHLRLEISVDKSNGDQAVLTHVLNLSNYCESNPEAFNNIDSGEMGCKKYGF